MFLVWISNVVIVSNTSSRTKSARGCEEQKKLPDEATAGAKHRTLADASPSAPAPRPSGGSAPQTSAFGPARAVLPLAPAPGPMGARIRNAFFGTLNGAPPAPQAPGPSGGTTGSSLRNLFWGTSPVLDGTTMVVPVIVDPLVHMSGGDGGSLRFSSGSSDQSSQPDQDMSQMLGNGQLRVRLRFVFLHPLALSASSQPFYTFLFFPPPGYHDLFVFIPFHVRSQCCFLSSSSLVISLPFSSLLLSWVRTLLHSLL